jgi:3'-5' exoribonuclease
VMREQSMRFPAGFITVLQHIIISHHGEPEFGAAKLPMTPEALLVSMLDNMDAKTHMALSAARPADRPEMDLGGNFTEKQWALAGVKLYRKDPLGK